MKIILNGVTIYTDASTVILSELIRQPMVSYEFTLTLDTNNLHFMSGNADFYGAKDLKDMYEHISENLEKWQKGEVKEVELNGDIKISNNGNVISNKCELFK